MKKMLILLAFVASLLSCGKDQKELSVTVSTGAATQITVSSATLNASFSNAVGLVREVGFEWGESATELGHTQQADWNLGQTSFSATIDNLGDNKTYYYRAYVILYDKDKIQTFSGAVTSFQTLEQAKPEPTTGNQPGWAELPVMKIKSNGDYMVNEEDANQYYAWHICPDDEVYGPVIGPSGKPARNYTVCYSAEDHVAFWVAAPRHPMYSKANVTRTDAYTWDPNIPKEIQYVKEGANAGGNGLTRGHMLGSAERRVSAAVNKQVFYHTNIAPQLGSGFNTGGGGWNILEDFVEKQECSDTLYVVIGCYFKDYKDAYGKEAKAKKISYGGREGDVSQPTMFYYALLRTKAGNSGKSVKDVSADDLKCAAFVRTHTNDHKGQAVTATEMMTIAELEKITGFSYFPNVPNAPKTSFKASDWGL